MCYLNCKRADEDSSDAQLARLPAAHPTTIGEHPIGNFSDVRYTNRSHPRSEVENVDYPRMLPVKNFIQPAPRRVRGYFAGQLMFDTTQALYVWEWPNYPQYYIPIDDVIDDLLVDEMYEKH